MDRASAALAEIGATGHADTRLDPDLQVSYGDHSTAKNGVIDKLYSFDGEGTLVSVGTFGNGDELEMITGESFLRDLEGERGDATLSQIASYIK